MRQQQLQRRGDPLPIETRDSERAWHGADLSRQDAERYIVGADLPIPASERNLERPV